MLKIIELIALVILMCFVNSTSSDKSANIPEILAASNSVVLTDESVVMFSQIDCLRANLSKSHFIEKLPNDFSKKSEISYQLMKKNIIMFGGSSIWHQFEQTRISKMYDDINSRATTTEENGVIEKTSEEPTISSEGPCRTYYYIVSDEEKLEMAMMVYAEANIEPFKGKVAVAAVILNRWVRDEYNTPIHDILTAKGQFTDMSYVTKELLDRYPDNYEAVEQALKGWDPTRELFPEGAHYFYAPKYVSEEAQKARDGVPTLTIGGHNFHDEFAK